MIDATRLGFDPFLGWPVLWLVAGLAALAWAAYIFLRGKAWLTRGLALTLLTAALSNPSLVQEEREPLPSVAAIILELVQGEGGFFVAPRAYIQGLREICDEHGIMLIIDEVQTGFARTGRWGAFEHYGITPDISTWAKSMGGGLPISAVIGRATVMDRVRPGTLGGTYGGNPVACAAALATIDKMESLDLNARAEHCGRIIRQRFEAIASETHEVVDVRGLGAMMAIEFGEDGDPVRPATALVKRIIGTCRDEGLVVIVAGTESNIIRVLAPIVISDTVLEKGLSILAASVSRHTHDAAHAVSGS